MNPVDIHWLPSPGELQDWPLDHNHPADLPESNHSRDSGQRDRLTADGLPTTFLMQLAVDVRAVVGLTGTATGVAVWPDGRKVLDDSPHRAEHNGAGPERI